jgi:amicyanin
MKKSLIFSVIVAVIATAVVVTGCTSSTPTTPTDNATGATAAKTDQGDSNAVSVNIENFAYQPSELTVKKGTTVTWTNSDSVIHTVTSTDGRFSSSGDLGKDATHQAQFNEIGTYEYYCVPHPYMKGKVVVEE